MSTVRAASATLARETPGARSGALFALVAGASFAAVAAALFTQHVWGMEPCAWCALQRIIFIAIGACALIGLAWRGPTGARIAGGLAVLLGAAGLATALWQHFVAAKSASCNLTFADRVVNATGLNVLLPDVFEARASCADAAASLLGVPYEFWSATLFVALAATAVVAVRRA